MQQVKVVLNCSRCGHRGLEVPKDESDDDQIVCPECETRLGVVADLNERIRQSISDVVAERLTRTIHGESVPDDIPEVHVSL